MNQFKEATVSFSNMKMSSRIFKTTLRPSSDKRITEKLRQNILDKSKRLRRFQLKTMRNKSNLRI